MSLTVPASHSFLTTDEQNVDLFLTLPELTVSQAAQILDLPEDGILELLKIGVLEHRQDGTQHLINGDKLLEYKQRRDRGRAMLDEMAREDQKMGFY